MKKISLNLISVLASVALFLSIFEGGLVTFAENVPSNENFTKVWNFDSEDDLVDFSSYYWARENLNQSQIKDSSVMESYRIENGALVRTRASETDWEGKINRVTALTLKDVKLKNFDLKFSMRNDLDNDYEKSFFVGIREVLPGQPSTGITEWAGGRDSSNNVRSDLYIRNNGTFRLWNNTNTDFGTAGTDYKGLMKDYRIRVVGANIQIWKYDITKQTPDETVTTTVLDEGFLSLCFINTLGALDNISITNLDDNGNEIAMPIASSKYFNRNAAVKSMSDYYREFVTESWNVDNDYIAYSGVNESCYKTDEWGFINSQLSKMTSGVTADNMVALTLNDSTIRNFEAEFKIRYTACQSHSGQFFINMREQTPGKAFSTTYTNDNMWPMVSVMNDGSKTVTFAPQRDSNVKAYNGSVKSLGSKSEDDNFHDYKIRLVGNALESWVDGVALTKFENLNVKNKGYVSIIAANAGIVIESMKYTWLDEEGNEVVWGTDTYVDSTRTWDFASQSNGNTTIFSDFRSSFWSSANGYTATDYVDSNLWTIGEWGNAENINGGRYANDWSNDGWSDVMAALTLNDNSFRNFDVTVKVKALAQNVPVMLSVRESSPGQPVPSIGSWSYGVQPNGKNNVVYKYFTNESKAMIHYNTTSVKTHESGVDGLGWNILRMRVVGNSVRTWLNGVEGTSIELDANTNTSGYVSVIFANTAGAIADFSITRLDENGAQLDYYTDKQLFISGLSDINSIGKISTMPIDGNYFLKNDIILEETDVWPDIIDFAGKFDGQGHRISGLKKTLFSNIAGLAEVKNLVIDGVTVNCEIGGSISRIANGADVKIFNVAVLDANITASVGGGYIGSVTSGKTTISNCSYQGYIGANYAGRFIGAGNGVKVLECCYVDGEFEAWDMGNDITLDNMAQMENSYYNISNKKQLNAFGFSEDLWIHDGNLPQLKITGADPYISGDINCDKKVDIKDLVRIKKYLSNESETEICFLAANMDGVVNSDGEVDIAATDIAALIRYMLTVKS